jgi:hypothetical protein
LFKFYPGKQAAKLEALSAWDLGCLYLSAFLFCKLSSILQLFVAFERYNSGVQNPDQYVFKTKLRDDPYVTLETEGPVGRFNRAQRGIDNYRELAPNLAVRTMLAGFMFPGWQLAVTCVAFISRVVYSAKYREDGNRAAGLLPYVFCNAFSDGIILVTGVKALN